MVEEPEGFVVEEAKGFGVTDESEVEGEILTDSGAPVAMASSTQPKPKVRLIWLIVDCRLLTVSRRFCLKSILWLVPVEYWRVPRRCARWRERERERV